MIVENYDNGCITQMKKVKRETFDINAVTHFLQIKQFACYMVFTTHEINIQIYQIGYLFTELATE